MLLDVLADAVLVHLRPVMIGLAHHVGGQASPELVVVHPDDDHGPRRAR